MKSFDPNYIYRFSKKTIPEMLVGIELVDIRTED